MLFCLWGVLIPSHSSVLAQSKSRALLGALVLGQKSRGSWFQVPCPPPVPSSSPSPPTPSHGLPFIPTISLALCGSFIISSHGVQASLVIQPFLQCFRNNHLEKNARFPSLESPWVMNLSQFGLAVLLSLISIFISTNNVGWEWENTCWVYTRAASLLPNAVPLEGGVKGMSTEVPSILKKNGAVCYDGVPCSGSWARSSWFVFGKCG